LRTKVTSWVARQAVKRAPRARYESAPPLPADVRVPHHLVIIPDGNRRWAKGNGVSKAQGHRKGAEVVENIVWQCRDWGVRVLTLWGFSTENWERPSDEVRYLMDLLGEFMERIEDDLHENEVRFRHLGRKDRLPPRLLEIIERAEGKTTEYSAYCLNLCLDYGGRDEIVRAARELLAEGAASEEITEERLGEHLDTAGVPDPDLIIRTSGERRLSGILPWQSVYAELAFIDEHLPDLTPDILKRVFEDYSQRQRRFGR
jgi:undecaprenyl diphosphate synthase